MTRNVAQDPLHHVTYTATKFKAATSNYLGGDTFTRNVTDGRTVRRTDDGPNWYKIIIPLFLKKKSGKTKARGLSS